MTDFLKKERKGHTVRHLRMYIKEGHRKTHQVPNADQYKQGVKSE